LRTVAHLAALKSVHKSCQQQLSQTEANTRNISVRTLSRFFAD